ncbi:phage head morphogenesis protein [Paracoccus versutus]
MVDPLTGETELVQLGGPRRLRKIYNANLCSACAAGQWERILLPGISDRPRREPPAGLILPVDSPFWDTWMPPNGWGCKFWARQVTKAEATRRRVSEEPEAPDRVVRNERTGEVRIVPTGIDPGWQANPGKLRLDGAEAFMAGKIRLWPDEAQVAALRDIATRWRVRRIMNAAPGRAPVGLLPAEIATRRAVGPAGLGQQRHVLACGECRRNRGGDDGKIFAESRTNSATTPCQGPFSAVC